MRVAVLSDIHANPYGLEVVLADVRAANPDLVLCCGDVVGYYHDPNRACRDLRALDPVVVRGNHDAYVIGALPPDVTKVAAYRTVWTREQLEPDHLAWLGGLPVERRLTLAGRAVRLRHASPWDEETYLFPETIVARAADFDLAPDEVLLVGHSHRPIRTTVGRGVLINPGSVGQPRDYDPRPCWALVTFPEATVEFRRLVYPVEPYQAELAALGWDEKVIQILSRRRN